MEGESVDVNFTSADDFKKTLNFKCNDSTCGISQNNTSVTINN